MSPSHDDGKGEVGNGKNAATFSLLNVAAFFKLNRMGEITYLTDSGAAIGLQPPYSRS
jgi:hypothetical protein